MIFIIPFCLSFTRKKTETSKGSMRISTHFSRGSGRWQLPTGPPKTNSKPGLASPLSLLSLSLLLASALVSISLAETSTMLSPVILFLYIFYTIPFPLFDYTCNYYVHSFTILFFIFSPSFIDKDQEQFTKQLLYYLGAFAGGIPVSTNCSTFPLGIPLFLSSFHDPILL